MGCLILSFFFGIKLTNAVSTCGYDEQVELSNVASTIQANYEVKSVVLNGDMEVVDGIPLEEARKEDSEYFEGKLMSVYITNITDKVYIQITNDKGMNKTYQYSDTNNGTIIFDGGDMNQIINYNITVLSNHRNCYGEVLRKISLTTPMVNYRAYSYLCQPIPNFEYCREYITAPFMASDTEIENVLATEYEKARNKQLEEENEKNKSFWDKIGDFVSDNQTIIIAVVVVIVIIGALLTIVIIKKRRSRVL